MRLSVLSTMAEAPWGGSEELWAGVASAAINGGWDVHALLPYFKDAHPKRTALADAGVSVGQWTYADIRKWGAGGDPAMANPYGSLLQPRPDLLVISHGGMLDMVNSHGGLLSDLWSSGVPYVLIIQANTEGYWPNDAQRMFMRRYFNGALQVVFVSRENLEIARRQLADPLHNAVVWQQPVNLTAVKPVKWPSEPVLAMASVARIDVLSKGHDMLIEILSRPVWRERQWKLNLYGTGASASLVEDSASVGGIRDRVQLHGQVSDIAQLWRSNHVLVMPSRLEGTPLALMEALCCGRPAMVTDVGGSADWVIENETGFIASAARTEHVADALERMWEKRSALRSMGETAAQFMAASFQPKPGSSLFAFLKTQLRDRMHSKSAPTIRPLLSVVRLKRNNQATLSAATSIPEVQVIEVNVGATATNASSAGDSVVINEPLQNLAVAANTGLAASNGECALILEGEGDWPEEHIRAVVAALKTGKAQRYLCAAPGTPPRLGVFPVAAWKAHGGFPAKTEANFQSWFWTRLQSHGIAPKIASSVAAAADRSSGTAPKVSVIITCYNYAQYLERAADSVLGQTFTDFELIIVDDGSTDDSPKIADAIAAHHPNKVRVLHQSNAGQPAISRNNGIRQARGEFILPLDADDWIAPTMLEECLAVFDAANVGVAYVDSVYCHEQGQVRIHNGGVFTVNTLREQNQLSCCSLYRKKIWEKIGGYRENVRGYEDWDFWLATAAAGFSGKRVPQPLFFYRAKQTGVFAQTAGKDKLLKANIRLNNPSCYTDAERADAKAYLASLSTPPARAETPISAPAPSTPSNAELRQRVAETYSTNDFAACVTACAAALAAEPNDCDILLVYADVLTKQSRFPEAIEVTDLLIGLQPQVADHRRIRESLTAALKAAPAATPAQKPSAPTVSVVIPCYKQAEYLTEAVESVVAQTYQDWEIIVVNDGSPDTTNLVAQQLIAKHPDRRIRLIQKANGGLADARNAGISLARGKYILPLDADDKIHPEMLNRTVSVLETMPKIAIAYVDWQYFGAETHVRQAIDYDFTRLCTKENLFTCTSLYRKEAWVAAGGYNRNMTRGLEDWDFWVGCGEKGYVGQRVPEPLFFYRSKEGSMIRTLQPHVRTMYAQIVVNHPKLFGAETLTAARRILSEANLPPPKPSSSGIEWTPEAAAANEKTLNSAADAVAGQHFDQAVSFLQTVLRNFPTVDQVKRAEAIANEIRKTGASQSPAVAVKAESPAVQVDFSSAQGAAYVEALVKAYAANPADADLLSQLFVARQTAADTLLKTEPARLAERFTSPWGKAYRQLIASGLALEPVSGEQQATLDLWLTALGSNPASQPIDVRPLLAYMLFAPAHRSALPFAFERMPAWFIDDYLPYLLTSPQVFVVAGEAEQYVRHLEALTGAVLQETRRKPSGPLTLKVALEIGTKLNCIPAYMSAGNTVTLMRNRAAILEFVLAKNGATLDAALRGQHQKGRKIRVGYLSAHFSDQTETHVTLPTLQLDRSRFEVWLFPLATANSAMETYCRSFSDRFVPLPKEVGPQVKALREAALDVIIIGTNVTAVTNGISLLAAHRLAPIQLVSYCSPMSTGFRNVDGFLYGSLSEFKGAADHFSEKLVVCDGPPGCLDYTHEKAGTMRFDRKSLGLADDDVVFVNAASCFKIPPELQDTWAKILKSVDKSRLLLLPFNPNWSSAFPAGRFKRTLEEALKRHGVGADRVIMAKSLPSRADVKALETVADVYLDTAPFSGSLSVIDPLELALPTLVWQSNTARGTAAAALMRDIDLPELIAADEAGYVDHAVRLGRDASYRAQISAKIKERMERKPRFLDPARYGAELSRVLEDLVLRRRPKADRPQPALQCA